MINANIQHEAQMVIEVNNATRSEAIEICADKIAAMQDVICVLQGGKYNHKLIKDVEMSIAKWGEIKKFLEA